MEMYLVERYTFAYGDTYDTGKGEAEEGSDMLDLQVRDRGVTLIKAGDGDGDGRVGVGVVLAVVVGVGVDLGVGVGTLRGSD